LNKTENKSIRAWHHLPPYDKNTSLGICPSLEEPNVTIMKLY